MARKHELHPEYRRKMLGDLAAILNIAVTEVPIVFMRAKPQALKIGTNEDLRARYPDSDVKALNRWLAKWTNTKQYLGRICYGTNRHDLDGNDCGIISDEERDIARSRFKDFINRQRKMREAA